jgi:hypothetical protein
MFHYFGDPMAVKILIRLLALSGHNATVEVEGTTVEEALRNLTNRFGEVQPPVRERSFRSYVNVYGM